MGETAATDLKKTPLHALHQSLGAKFAPFAGYDMPIQYPSGILAEHHHVREKAGLFDVSHMGQGFLTPVGWSEGADRGDGDHASVAALLEELTPSDLAGLAPGEMRYSLLLNDKGRHRRRFHGRPVLRSGASGRAIPGGQRRLQGRRFRADCAGAQPPGEFASRRKPRAAGVARPAGGGSGARNLSRRVRDGVHERPHLADNDRRRNGRCDLEPVRLYREDGFEISVPSDHAQALAEALLAHPDVQPIGLGARDSLRLEAGLCLYGHDMDAARTPVEASLTWAVAKRRRAEANFPGAERILQHIQDKPAERRVGLKLLGKAPAREGADIALKSGEIVGRVTSGGPGPSYGAPIAMGYVARAYAALGTELDIIVRDRPRAAEIVATPFVKQNYHRG